ncbi:MAG: imidazolonepropionase [Spirochaetaceae bacterium]|nr:imidazolonepropionase [Spirochaetaceae bacterium]
MIMGIGPFTQMLTMDEIPRKGPVSDSQLKIIHEAAIVLSGDEIIDVGTYRELKSKYSDADFLTINQPKVCMPGFVDVHTHLCWGGSRSTDYSQRIAGKSYLEIAREGGGINVSVKGTRAASESELINRLTLRALRHLSEGVTTCEVKSGYGLSEESEIKILKVIKETGRALPIDLIPTVLSAHIKPFDFQGTPREYLDYVIEEILPEIKWQKLSERADIFVDQGAFSLEDGEHFLKEARKLGFSLTIHADQFTTGGSRLAVEYGALSADHLECISDADLELLAHSDTAAVVLPGCSLGLGINYAPARRLLDAGASLVISTDWNPGSAPMGDLLLEASLISAAQKLSTAETFSAITFRAACALNLHDRGILKKGYKGDFLLFPTDDYREILYNQGKLKPDSVWKSGKEVK